MKRILAIVGALVIAVGLMGEETLRDKDLAVLFTLNGLSTIGLGNYQDPSGLAGIGFKNCMGDQAVRALLVFGIGSSSHDPSSKEWVGQESSSTRLGLSVDYLKQLTQTKIAPFIGVGGGFSSEKEKEEPAHLKSSKGDISETSISRFFLRGILGVEMFIKKNVSLTGEYALEYSKSTQTDKFTSGSSGTSSTTKRHGTALGLGSAGRLVLSVYFGKGLF